MQASAPPSCSNENSTAALSSSVVIFDHPESNASALEFLNVMAAWDLEGSRVGWFVASTPSAEDSTRKIGSHKGYTEFLFYK